MKDRLRDTIFWSLPYEMRQSLFRARYPEADQVLQAKRTVPDANRQFLKPFDDRECLFVHIPKCAGISVSQSLFGCRTGSHLTIRDLQLVYSRGEFDRYFKFTFVRNPWDRLVSAFFFLKKGGFGTRDRSWSNEVLSVYSDFDTFVKDWLTPENIYSYLHFVPQHKFLRSQGNHPVVDFIGRYESLEEDFLYIQKKLGINAELKHLNITEGHNDDYRTYFSDETANIVADVYREDLLIFRYSFDDKNTCPAQTGRE